MKQYASSGSITWIRNHNVQSEDASAHKSAKTHAGNVFVTRADLTFDI